MAEAADGSPVAYFLKVSIPATSAGSHSVLPPHPLQYLFPNPSSTTALVSETARLRQPVRALGQIVRAPDAADRVLGEYMSMSEIHKTLPSIAPQPHGYGKCHDENVHFFLCDFLDITNDSLPDPVRLGRTLADLHRESQSPTGQFGFHCTTFDGKLPLTTTWNSNWTAFFTRLLQDVYALDVRVNGPWPELDAAMATTVAKVIPRLLNALTAPGRTLKPTLIHGDLWESNIGTDVHTGGIYIYDACA